MKTIERVEKEREKKIGEVKRLFAVMPLVRILRRKTEICVVSVKKKGPIRACFTSQLQKLPINARLYGEAFNYRRWHDDTQTRE